jgi:chromosome segregation ATPase
MGEKPVSLSIVLYHLSTDANPEIIREANVESQNKTQQKMATLKSAIAKFLGLTQKLETIEKNLNRLTESVSAETVSRQELEEVSEKVDDIESTVSDADSKVDDIESTVSDFDSRLDDLESKIDNCESEINDIDDKVSNAVDEIKDEIRDEISEELSEQVEQAIAETRKEVTKQEVKELLQELLAENKALKLIVRDTLIEVLNSK